MTSNNDSSKNNKRVQQKKNTARLILRTAKKLFHKQGFENTTTRSIASSAGVGIGTVFVHYPDKISLLGQVLREDIDQIMKTTFQSLDKQQGLIERLVHLSSGLLAYFSENQSLTREFIKHTTFEEGPEAQAFFNKQMEDFGLTVYSIIENAVKDHSLDKDIPITTMTQNYMAIHFFVVNLCLRKKSSTLDAQIKQLTSMVNALFKGYELKPST